MTRTSKTATRNTRPKEEPESRRVYLVDGARTPFLKAKGRPGPFSPVDLAVQCGRPLLLRQPIPADAYDQVILGCVNVVPSESGTDCCLAPGYGRSHARVYGSDQLWFRHAVH